MIHNPDKGSNMHVQGHIKTVLFLALKISWYKSLPQMKSKKKWLQRNDAIWVSGFLSLTAMPSKPGRIAQPFPCSTRCREGAINLSWNWSASGWVQWKHFFWPAWIPWFSCGLGMLSLQRGKLKPVLLSYMMTQTPGLPLEIGVGRATCQPSPPPSWSLGKITKSWISECLQMSFFDMKHKLFHTGNKHLYLETKICISV